MGFSTQDVQQVIQNTGSPDSLSTRRKIGYFSVMVDFTQPLWNTVGKHQVLNIMGNVRLRVLPKVVQNCISSNNTATIQLGYTYQTNKLLQATQVTNLPQPRIWNGTMTSNDMPSKDMIDVILYGVNSIGIEVMTENLTGGQIVFDVWWEPLDNAGNVNFGNGGIF